METWRDFSIQSPYPDTLKVATMLTADRLRELLSYEPETGAFTWRVNKGCVRAGRRAGCQMPNGYWQITIDGTNYVGHRLVWLYVFGRWPLDELDHEDRDKGNIRLRNLREATHKENLFNVGVKKNNTSGYTGVSFRKGRNTFRAHVKIDGKYIHLGTFTTAGEAHAAYQAAIEYRGDFRPEPPVAPIICL